MKKWVTAVAVVVTACGGGGSSSFDEDAIGRGACPDRVAELTD